MNVSINFSLERFMATSWTSYFFWKSRFNYRLSILSFHVHRIYSGVWKVQRVKNIAHENEANKPWPSSVCINVPIFLNDFASGSQAAACSGDERCSREGRNMTPWTLQPYMRPVNLKIKRCDLWILTWLFLPSCKLTKQYNEKIRNKVGWLVDNILFKEVIFIQV